MTTNSLNQAERLKILASIKKLVPKHHINIAGIDYEAWKTFVDKQTPDLLARNLQEFEDGVRSLLKELKTSHVAFYRERPDRLPPQHSVGATLRKLTDSEPAKWMFLDVFEGGPAHIAGIKPGDLLLAIEHAECDASLPEFAVGQNYRISVSDFAAKSLREVTVEIPFKKGTQDRPPIVEPKSPIHRMIAPGLGLLKVPYFPGPMGLAFGKELDAAVADFKIQGCTRLIVDLRGNIGGGLGLAKLASYMCPGQLPIGQSLTPRRLRTGTGYQSSALPRVPMPQGRAALVTTFGRFAFKDKSIVLMTQSLGPQPFHGSTVVLINEWTNSAGEMVASFASQHRLATLVGVKTAGNVLGGTNLKLRGGYRLRIPVFGWYASTGEQIEGVGVSPDVTVCLEPEWLSKEIDNQMIEAIKLLEPPRVAQH